MADSSGTDLLSLTDYRRMREDMSLADGGPLGRLTVLSSTLLAELGHSAEQPDGTELIDMLAACRRHHEPALVCLSHEGMVWPVTVFPAEMIYHSPRDVLSCPDRAMARLKVLSIEPAAVRPPGHWMRERVAAHELYRPLVPMLWSVALHGPSRHTLVPAIGGIAAYRVPRSLSTDGLSAPGALGAASERLRREPTSLRAVSQWPGMDLERGVRLLNALHLVSNLIVSRTHQAARAEPRSQNARNRPV